MSDTLLFEEKQYLGLNKYSLFMRMAFALLCFTYYFYNANIRAESDIFMLLGWVVIAISVVLFFVLHIHTKVYSKSVVLDGFWTTRKIKIDLSSIIKIEEVEYDRFVFNNPVYNLHLKGTIRFYTRGSKAVRLTDHDGLVYIIGTQDPEKFIKALKSTNNY